MNKTLYPIVCLLFSIKCYSQSVGIGSTQFTPVSTLDVKGSVTIGSGASYAGGTAAPSNGLLVEGQAGIGTSAPLEQFQIGDRWTFHNGGWKIIGYNLRYNTSSGFDENIFTGACSRQIFTSNGQIRFQVAASQPAGTDIGSALFIEGIMVANSGNVGIGGNFASGAPLPASKFAVNGNAVIGTSYYSASAAPTNGLLVVGNVGIGTSSPVSNLDVTGVGNTAGQASLNLRSGNSGNTYTSNQISMAWNAGSSYRHAIKTRHNSAGAPDNSIDFYVWNFGTDAAGTIGTKHIMTLDGYGSGGVGIGTVYPQNKLDVEGGAVVGATYSGNGAVSAPSNGLLVEGSVGIGTTTVPCKVTVVGAGTAGANDPSVLALSGAANAFAGFGVGRTAREANFGVAGNNGDYFSYATPGDVTLRTVTEDLIIGVSNNTGSIRFGTGTLYSETEKMTINNSGDVLLGTTSAVSKFYISGDQSSSKRQLAMNSWADVSANGGGAAVFGGNMFTDNSAVNYKYANTHGSIGGIGFAVNYPSWNQASVISSNTTSSTAGTAFTPKVIITFNYDGKVGIGSPTPAQALDVVGNGTFTGTVTASCGVLACSDYRYKTNINPLNNALNNVLKMQGVNYYWKTKEFPQKNFTSEKQIGVIAQDLEKIYPELVFTDDKGYKTVDYTKLTPILIEAMKEQQKLIELLSKRIDQLEIINAGEKASK